MTEIVPLSMMPREMPKAGFAANRVGETQAVMELVKAVAISKSYARDGRSVDALTDLDLQIAEGEFVSIVGPSGCGKSTFLHILGGLVPQSAGTLTVDGVEVTRPGPDRGIMFQESALYPWRSVAGNISWPLEVQGFPRRQREEIVADLLRMIGLTQFKDHYPNQLSGGMKQRVALARVLSFKPRLLLMDEPFGALDAQTRELMQEEIQIICSQTRQTVLFITHDLDEAIYLSDRVLIFSARPGRIKVEIAIELTRPRQPEIRKSPAYAAYRNEIWDILREEVLKARAL
jgi:NitT/TauT family transport system ATP-binding protein